MCMYIMYLQYTPEVTVTLIKCIESIHTQEVYGEDPYLSGALAAAYVKGLQGSRKYVRANAGCKVVSVHSGPENIPTSRFSFNSIVRNQN